VDSSSLQAEQVERMLAMIFKQRDYLHRLIERMRQRRFPHDDPLHLAALAAMEKASNLSVVLARYRKDDAAQESVNEVTKRRR
jgi:hypothetical protein